MEREQIYLEGPIFNPGQATYMAHLKKMIEECSVVPVVFSGDLFTAEEIKQWGTETPKRIFERCRDNLLQSSILIAVLDGPQVDDGTAWSIGAFHLARGGRIFGIRQDVRLAGETRFSTVNAMVEGSCTKIFTSSTDLLEHLMRLQGGNTKGFTEFRRILLHVQLPDAPSCFTCSHAKIDNNEKDIFRPLQLQECNNPDVSDGTLMIDDVPVEFSDVEHYLPTICNGYAPISFEGVCEVCQRELKIAAIHSHQWWIPASISGKVPVCSQDCAARGSSKRSIPLYPKPSPQKRRPPTPSEISLQEILNAKPIR